jgi:3-methyladenine DNA glycosylase AlkD
MTANEIMAELAALGSEPYRALFLRHGAPEAMFGVKIEDMKKIVRREKKNQALALELYDTGNSDAMYLAGLLADEKKMTKAELQQWVGQASWYMISDYTVAWVAAETPFGWELGLEWIDSPHELVASAGWATLASWMTIRPDTDLDLDALRALLDRVAATLQQAPNRVRYTMNGFVIAAGITVAPLTEYALATARKVGKVSVDMGDTACNVPGAVDYIEKARAAGKIGRKKKMARC